MIQQISDKELLDKLREHYNKTGEVPKCSDFSNSATYKKRFGSWNNAIELIELSPNKKFNKKHQVLSFTCKTCGEIFTRNSRRNPKYCSIICRNRKTIWNKGLNCDNDDRIRNISNTLVKKYKTGELVPKNKGISTTNEIKQKIINGIENSRRKDNTIHGHGKILLRRTKHIYKKLDGSTVELDSGYEKTVAESLDANQITWIRPNPIKYVDKNGLTRNYYPDFYLPDYDVYLDPKADCLIEKQNEKLSIVMQIIPLLVLRHRTLKWHRILPLIETMKKVIDE